MCSLQEQDFLSNGRSHPQGILKASFPSMKWTRFKDRTSAWFLHIPACVGDDVYVIGEECIKYNVKLVCKDHPRHQNMWSLYTGGLCMQVQ